MSSSRAKAKNKVVAEIAKQKASPIGELHVEPLIPRVIPLLPNVIPLLPCVIKPLLSCFNLNSALSSSENYQSLIHQTGSMETAVEKSCVRHYVICILVILCPVEIPLQGEQQNEQAHSSIQLVSENIPCSQFRSRCSSKGTQNETLNDPQPLGEMPTTGSTVRMHLVLWFDFR